MPRGHHISLAEASSKALRIPRQTLTINVFFGFFGFGIWIALLVVGGVGGFKPQYLTYWTVGFTGLYFILRFIGRYVPWIEVVTVLGLMPFAVQLTTVVLIVVHYIFFITGFAIPTTHEELGVSALGNLLTHVLMWMLVLILTVKEIDRLGKFQILMTSQPRYVPLLIFQPLFYLVMVAVYALSYNFQEVYKVSITVGEAFALILGIGLFAYVVLLALMYGTNVTVDPEEPTPNYAELILGDDERHNLRLAADEAFLTHQQQMRSAASLSPGARRTMQLTSSSSSIKE